MVIEFESVKTRISAPAHPSATGIGRVSGLDYAEVECLNPGNEPSNEIDRVSKFDNSLSLGAKQNALRQIFFALWFFKDLFTKNSNEIFSDFFYFV